MTDLDREEVRKALELDLAFADDEQIELVREVAHLRDGTKGTE